MAYIVKTKKGYGIRFWYDTPEGKKQKYLSGFKTKQEAQRAEYEFKIKYEHLDKNTDITFDVLFTKYQVVAQSQLKTGSYVSNESKIRLYVMPYFKDKIVKNISSRDIIDWKLIIENSYNFSYYYKRGIFNSFSALMGFAEKYYGIKNDALKIAGNFVNKEIPKEMDFWTEEEFLIFINKVDSLLYKTLFSFLFLTGCRRGEALALQWKDYDGKSVSITKSVNYKSKKNGRKILGYEITTPKNKYSVRTVTLPANLCELLNQLQLKTKGDYIFNGYRPLPKSKVQRAFDYYINLAGVKKIRIHDLRHSHATMLFHKGFDVLEIAKRLGHANAGQLLKRYAHVLPDKNKDLLKAINFSLNK